MKKQFLWLPAAILAICGATMLTSCSDNDDNSVLPEEPATDDVRLTKMVAVSLMPNGNSLAVSTQNITWEDGLLRNTSIIIQSPITDDIVIEENYVYEGTNCTEVIHSSGTHDRFTYANGGLQSAVSTASDGSVVRIDVTAYTLDGHISEMTREVTNEGVFKNKTSYTFTWENGDVASFVKHPINPAGDDTVETYTYYDVPSPFTGYPVVHYIWNADEIAFRGSKHHIKMGDNAKFENGRIVSETRGLSTNYFVYSDGTGSNYPQ